MQFSNNMYYLLRISNPASESWVFLYYAIMLASLFVASRISPGIITISFQALFSNKERDSIFYEGSFVPQSRILTWITCIGTMALDLHLIVFQGGEFRFIHTLMLYVLVLAVFAVRYIIGRWICYTFVDSNIFDFLFTHYQRLLIAMTVVLLPITLMAIFFIQTYRTALIISMIVIIFAFLATLFIKIIRLFSDKILASFYILLYLCSVEILPLLGLVYAAEFIVK